MHHAISAGDRICAVVVSSGFQVILLYALANITIFGFALLGLS